MEASRGHALPVGLGGFRQRMRPSATRRRFAKGWGMPWNTDPPPTEPDSVALPTAAHPDVADDADLGGWRSEGEAAAT